MLMIFMGACAWHTGEVVSSVQLVPSTLPLTPGTYQSGSRKTVDGCDTLQGPFTVAFLLDQIRGPSQGLTEVVIEQYDRYRYQTLGREVFGKPDFLNSRCWRITAVPVWQFK